jgi:hypothetical protein
MSSHLLDQCGQQGAVALSVEAIRFRMRRSFVVGSIMCLGRVVGEERTLVWVDSE